MAPADAINGCSGNGEYHELGVPRLKPAKRSTERVRCCFTSRFFSCFISLSNIAPIADFSWLPALTARDSHTCDGFASSKELEVASRAGGIVPMPVF